MMIRRRKKHLVPALAGTAAILAGVLAGMLGLVQGEAEMIPPPETRAEPPQWQTRQEVFSLVLPWQTEYIRDDTLPAGMEKELTPGRDGELLCTAQVDYLGGMEMGRRILEREMTIPYQNRVIAQGPMPKLGVPVIEDSCIQLPDGSRMRYTRSLSLRASAYTHTDPFRSQTTALGTPVHIGTVAVNPSKIPYGTRMFLITQDGSRFCGIVRAEDSLVGNEGTDIALYFPTTGQCMDFGTQDCTAYFLG